jgi:hypothetical protein
MFYRSSDLLLENDHDACFSLSLARERVGVRVVALQLDAPSP